jgi:hypothetical protein
MQLVADLVENKLKPHLLVQGEFSKKLILEKHMRFVNRRSGNAKAQFNNNHMGEIITF